MTNLLHIRNTCLFLTISLVGFSGCALEDEATLGGSLEQNLLSQNLLSQNGLDGSLEVDDLAATAEGRALLTYIAKCALPAGENLSTTSAGTPYTFSGLLGVAPEWKYQAIGYSKREAMTACLMAHVNHFGESVPFSARSVQLEASAQEQLDYPFFEGAFFGDLFDSEPTKYACSGDLVDPATAGWRTLRVCTDVESGSSTYCGFTYVGPCDQVCTSATNGSYQSCTVDGQNFIAPMSVYLID